jgi:LacI family transcriptional regulator
MVTIDDIAREAGVSNMTVSRVLNGKGKNRRPDANERASRIMGIAARMGYRPHAGAISVATGRFNNLSLVVCGTDRNLGLGWVPLSALVGMSRRTREAGYSFSVVDLASEELTEGDEALSLSTLRQWCTDGVIFNYVPKLPAQVRDLVERYRTPAVYMNAKADVNAVYFEDVGCGRELVRHAAECGHRRIGYITWHTPDGHYSEQDRLTGYRLEMRERGLECREILVGQKEIDARDLRSGRLWLDRFGDITAVICQKKPDAARIHLAALEKGISVPAQLSIITVDDDVSGETHETNYSAMIAPFRQLGEEAVSMLLQRIKSQRNLKSRSVACEWNEGQTLAAPQPGRR